MAFKKGHKYNKSTKRTISHRVRTKDEGLITLKPYGRKLAMAVMCTECMGFEANPGSCGCKTCPIYPYRAITSRTKKGDNEGV